MLDPMTDDFAATRDKFVGLADEAIRKLKAATGESAGDAGQGSVKDRYSFLHSFSSSVISHGDRIVESGKLDEADENRLISFLRVFSKLQEALWGKHPGEARPKAFLDPETRKTVDSLAAAWGDIKPDLMSID